MPTIAVASEVYVVSGGSAHNVSNECQMLVKSGGRIVVKSGETLYEIPGGNVKCLQ